MSKSKLIAALAKVAVGATFAGPLAGSQVAANQAIDLFSGWLGADRVPTYESTLARIRTGVARFAQAERIDDDQVEQALAQATEIVRVHGLDSGEISRLDLKAERVAETVLARATLELSDMDEAAGALCRLAIRTVYSSMLSAPEALPELERAFQRAVLTRLTELQGQSSEVMMALRGALRRAAVTIPNLQWDSDVFSANALLRPEFAVVPFYGRAEVVADLLEWARSDRGLAVRLYTGAGGMGKTRLMIHCSQRLPQGWNGGFLNREIIAKGWLPLDYIFERNDRLFIVLDYAETRAPEVEAVVRRALMRTGEQRVRIVLLARAVGDWWRDLKTLGQGVGDVLSGPATMELRLAPVARHPEQRRDLFDSAARTFAAVLPDSTIPSESPTLEGKHYDRVLYVLLTALAAVQGEVVKEEEELLDSAQRREQRFLDDGIVDAGYGSLRGRPILQCAAVATMAGRAASRAEAVRLISAAPLLKGQPDAVVYAVAELLHRLYPGEEAWLQGMQPDLLGEHLVERALEEDPGLAEAAFGPPGRASRAE